MIPHFDYINIPYGMRLLLKQYLKNASSGEHFISSIIAKDQGLKMLLTKQFSVVAKDSTISGMVRVLGWDFFRRATLSLYLHKEEQGIWPQASIERPQIDLSLMTLDEWFGNFSHKGYFRHSLLIFYLRIMEIRLQRKTGQASSLISGLMQQLDHLSKSKRSSDHADLLILIYWHFVEYYHARELQEKLKQGLRFEQLFEQLGPHYQRVMLFNIAQYLMSIGDVEPFQWEMVA